LTASWNPGHLASRGWSCRDAGQHVANPRHPGKSGTGGNPSAQTVPLPCQLSSLIMQAMIPWTTYSTRAR